MKLSASKRGETKPKKHREPLSKIMVRVLAFILVLLMLSGTLYYLFDFLFLAINAQEYNLDLMIRVGLMYGSGVTVGFETTAERGFSLGYVDSQNRYTALKQVADAVLAVTCDANLNNTNRTFTITDSQYPAVGGYHIEISGQNLYQYYDTIAVLVSSCGYTPFPAYINGEFKIRAGSFGTEGMALAALQSLPENLIQTVSSISGGIKTVSPSSTAVSVVNPYTNAIVFELDSANRSIGLGMEALQVPGAETAYMITPANNKYEGVFDFRRNFSEYKDGVALTNIVTLEQYTLGVLPYEIGANWPAEAQKAFAVAVRSFVLSHLGKHNKAYGFDVCNGTDCQVFRGVGSANDNVRQAVDATAGQVLVYNGTIARTFFSSSTGGTTVSAADAWNSNPLTYPYLAAKPTPWEHYAEHTYGEWKAEVSPTELCNALRAKGYTLLRGAIADIKINSTGQNSTYITSITFTDIYGTPVTINTSDNIRIALSAHVRSANFQVAPAGQTVVLTDYFYPDAVHVFGVSGKSAISTAQVYRESPAPKLAAFTLPSDTEVKSSQGGSTLTVITSAGSAAALTNGVLSVLTSAGPGVADTSTGYLTAQTSTGKLKFILPDETELGITPPGGNNSGSVSQNPLLPKLSTLTVSSSSRYVVAEGTPGNFVFIGRGYGHGVGMSQWGVYDLAKLGYSYTDILDAYYTGTAISDYRLTQTFIN